MNTVCVSDGCGGRYYGQGLCRKHYEKARRAKTILIQPRIAGFTDPQVEADLREFVARDRSDAWIGRELGYSSRTIIRWRKELDLKRPSYSGLPTFTLPAGLSLGTPFTSSNKRPSVRVVGREK